MKAYDIAKLMAVHTWSTIMANASAYKHLLSVLAGVLDEHDCSTKACCLRCTCCHRIDWVLHSV